MNNVTRSLRDSVGTALMGVSRFSSIIRHTAVMVVLSFVFVGAAAAQVVFTGPYSVDEDAGSVLVTINYTAVTGTDLIISYYTSNGTALVDEDYTETTGTFTIPAGSVAGSRNFSIPIVNDGIGEDWVASTSGTGTETFDVNLTHSGGGIGVAPDTEMVTINDDESIGQISINDASAGEGGSAVFTLTNTIPQDGAFTAVLGCTLGTASASDFDGGSCTPVATAFLVGQTSTSAVVEYDEDASYEGDENYEVTITGDPDYTIGDGVGNGIITENDPFPKVSINDSSADEGAGTMMFTVTADRPAEDDYDVHISYIDLTAIAGDDYSAAPVMVTMVGGMTSAAVAVPISDDIIVEEVELFAIQLVDGAVYDLGDDTGSGIINDDDGLDFAVTASLDVTELDLDGGMSAATLTVVVTNNGAADAGVDVALSFVAVGLDVATVTTLSDGAAAASCPAMVDLGAGCVVELADLESGESVTLTISDIEGAGDPGTAGSLTVTASTTETDYDLTNNSATDSVALVGLDFGDHGDGGDTAITLGAYHRLTTSGRLGALVDAETDGVLTAAADGDDLAGVDDEDGVTVVSGSTLYASTTNYIGVNASEAGYLSIFSGPTGAAMSVTAVSDMPVVPGMNWVSLNPGVAATRVLRFRFCSTIDTCDTSRGIAPDGEVEDHEFTIVAMPASVTLTIPDGTLEPVIIEAAATNEVTLKDGNGDVIFESGMTLTDLTINGNDNANTFVVDIDDFSTDFPLTLDGMGGSDVLEVVDTDANVITTITHNANNATDGSVAIDGLMDILYQNFEPILDNLTPANRVFNFSASDDNIVLRDNGSLIDGLTFIDSDFAEAYTFGNPTATLTVNGNDGDDTIDFQGVDESNAAAFAIEFNGGMGRDHFALLPFPNTAAVSISGVNGDDPAVCQGDVLEIVTTGGAVVDTSSLVAGSGSVIFTSAHPALVYTGMEGFANHTADVSLVMTSPVSTATNPGDNLTITLVVTNNGPDVASCVVVDDILMGGALSLTGGPTFSQGSFNTPEWEVGPLASGASATITYDVVVGPVFNGTATITALSPESDPDLTNNTVSLQIDPAFFFPVKAQATAAVWFDQGLGENLIVGTANGFAGLNSSVLCRVDTFGGIFPENLWRECGEGLPYPLYVNDMFVDTQGTLNNDDDLIYLASWGSAGLYVSDDGGESFTAVEPNLGPKGGWAAVYAITQDVDGFLYISTNHGFLYRSLNNGLTWQQIGSLPEVDADTPWSLTTHPTEAGRLYAGTFGRGVYTSDDYGFTWEFLGSPGVNQLLIAAKGGHAFDLELDPTGSYLFNATGGGVFRMELDGVGEGVGIWQMLETEITLSDGSMVTPEARSLSFDSAGQLYVTTWGFGAFFSAAPTVSNVMAELALRGEELTFVSVSPSGDQVAFGSASSGVVVLPAASVSTSIEDAPLEGELPSGYVLEQNYPNPFNPVTTISFALPETGQVRLAVYDVLGREVAVLVDKSLQGGQHALQFDAAGLPTGTYIYRLETASGSFAKQLILMK